MNLPIRRFETKDEIINHYPEYIEINVSGEFAPGERMFGDIPRALIVVKINHPSEYMVYARYGNNDEWHANAGERFVIRELLNGSTEKSKLNIYRKSNDDLKMKNCDLELRIEHLNRKLAKLQQQMKSLKNDL
jgi:hypothetical protein